MRKSVAVIDYGMGNLHSVVSAVAHEAPDREIFITADAARIRAADHVIFPGVGAIRDCMHEIRRFGIDQLIPDIVAGGQPLLGICVGMQALMRHSEENNGIDCLHLFAAEVTRFPERDEKGVQQKVPHMGWNRVAQVAGHPLWQGIDADSRFYFVHSYYVALAGAPEEIGRCHYGVDFAAAVARGNVAAVQFHPEKSGSSGLRLIRNFLSWNGG